MEEKYNQYLQYDFNNSEEYKDFKEKFPPESNESVEEHQKRFYKSHICRDFDTNYRPPQSPNRNNNNQNQRNDNNRENININHNSSPPLLEIIDFGLIGLSLMTFILSTNYYLFELMIYFIYRSYITTGLPRFNLDYLKIIIHQNNFNYFILCLVLMVTKTYNIYIILPMTIYTSLYLVRGINKYLKNSLIDNIVRYNTHINDLILYFEIINLISPIIGLFLGYNRFYFIFVYLQYMKFRYYASNKIKEKFNAIRVQLEITRSNSNNPLLRGLASIVQKIGNAFSNGFVGGNVVMFNGGFVACNIF